MEEPLSRLGVPWWPAATTLGAARKLWRQGKVDIVHAHMTAAESAALPNRLRNGGRLVVTRHFGQRRGLTALGGLAARVINKMPHTEVAISRYVQSTIGVPSKVVHHGIDDAPAVDPSRSKVVLVIQRLEVEKRTSIALRAWRLAGLASDGWQLIVAGDGTDRAALESLARAEGIASSVRFLGHVWDVDGLRGDAAIQVASPPSEHFGLSVLEAMARGLPVVACDGGAHRELVGESYPMLFPLGDVAAAAACLQSLAINPSMRSSLGRELRRRQQEHFSLRAHGEALEAVYLDALGRTSVSAP